MALRSILSKLVLRPSSSLLVKNIHSSMPIICSNLVNTQCHCIRLFQLATINTKANVKVDGFDESKAKLVSSLNFKSTADALPFYKLPISTLLRIQKVVKKDVARGYCENRLYYISSRLQVPPSVLSAKLVKRTFIYSLSFEWIKKALDVLLEMGVSSSRILRDLWVLKYHHETIHERLQLVKDSGIEKLCPWMVRCTDDILRRFISISQETRDILGEIKTTQVYLANRLGSSIEDIEELCVRLPAFKTIRVTKVKKFLDFLLNEGFDTEDIRNKPRVLSASQKTVKERIEKLRSLGVHDINLNVLCRSKKDFKKLCDTLESMSKESNKKNEAKVTH